MRVGIIGGSGYAGGEMLRLLLHHPDVEVTRVRARTI
jgi:N-acetyl-gamma-glutamylphosphate reductase